MINKENLPIIDKIKSDFRISLSPDEKRENLNQFISLLTNYFKGSSNPQLGDILDEWLRANESTFHENRVSVPLNHKTPKGSKVNKALKFFFSDQGSLRWAQDLASRYMQFTNLSGNIYITKAKNEFLTMSENNYNWSSCCALDGSWNAAGLSYYSDEVTVMFFLAEDKKKTIKSVPEVHDKKWRMLAHIHPDGKLIWWNRQYPYSNSNLFSICSSFFEEKGFTKPEQIGFNVYGNTKLNNTYFRIGFDLYNGLDIIDEPQGKILLNYNDLLWNPNFLPSVSYEKNFNIEKLTLLPREVRLAVKMQVGAPVRKKDGGYLRQKESFNIEDYL